MTEKKRILEIVREMPDDLTKEDVVEKLRFLQTVERGLKAVEEGQLLSHEEAKKRLGKWLEG